MRTLTDGECDIVREQGRDADPHPCRGRGRHWSAALGAWCEWSAEDDACLPIPRVETDDDLPF